MVDSWFSGFSPKVTRSLPWGLWITAESATRFFLEQVSFGKHLRQVPSISD
jgi:hypothetical protein